MTWGGERASCQACLVFDLCQFLVQQLQGFVCWAVCDGRVTCFSSLYSGVWEFYDREVGLMRALAFEY